MSKYDFKGKVAIITGGGRGIGRAIALELARCGAELVLASSTEEELTGVVNDIEAAGGKAVAQVTPISCPVIKSTLWSIVR